MQNMIMNISTNDIMQNGASEDFRQSSTPSKVKVQKIQKKIRKESSCSTSTVTKSTPKQQQKQQQFFKVKQGASQLASPSWSDKTVNLAPQESIPSLNSRYSISTMCNSSTYSQNSQCFANTPLLDESQQNYQGFNRKKSQTQTYPRSQSSSLTSEISSFDLYSYNECAGSSTSSTNSGVNNQQLHTEQNYSYGVSTLQNNTIKFSELISSKQENNQYQQSSLKPLDNHSLQYSPKSQSYYQQNIGGQQYSQQQKNNLNNINYNMNINNTYNSRNQISLQNNELANWNVLPFEIQKAVCDMNGQIQEVQKNFDNVVPQIEISQNRQDAYLKVKEAQQIQEQLVYSLFNIKQGTSLQEAVDNLVKQMQNKSNPESNEQVTKFSNSHIKIVLAKPKKNSKKSPKQEKICFQNIQNSPQKIQNQAQSIQNYSSNVQNQCQNVQSQFQSGIIGNHQMTQQNTQIVEHKNNKVQQNENVVHLNQYNNYLSDEQDIQNKEIINKSSSSYLNNAPQQLNIHHNNQQFNHPHHQQTINNNYLNKNNTMSPRKGTLSIQGYEEDMSQQEPMNNQMNQYDEYAYQPKLRKYMSDPFGDYYYNNNHGYYNENSHLQKNLINQSDNLDGGLSAIYEEEDPYYNKSNCFKKDQDDTLYGAYVSQNDTIEDLINSQSNNKQNKQPYYYSSENNNLNSSGYFNSAMDDEMGTSRHYNRDTVVESFAGSSEVYCGNTKQRTSSVATTDLYNSQRKIDFEYGFEDNISPFNKIY